MFGDFLGTGKAQLAFWIQQAKALYLAEIPADLRSEDVRNDVAIGSGQIDVAGALREAVKVGVKHFFIEDESPAVLQQIPQSLRYVESLAW